MGINRRKNSGSRKYYISELTSSADWVYGEVCKIGADSTNQHLKLDGVAYAGPLEIRKDDFIAVTRVASAAGVGSVLRLTSSKTGLSAGDEVNFTIKNIILDDRAGGQLIKKTFKIIVTATDIATDAALNDRVLAEMQNFFGSVAPHYTVNEQSSTTVDIEDNIGGSLAHAKVNGYLEGEVELGYESNSTNVTGSVTTSATKPEGVRGVINRFVDEADFSTGDVYTTVTIEYWDRDADGRARGDVMVRSQAVIYYNETDIAAAADLGSALTYLNSLVDHLVGYSGVGVGDAIKLTTSASATGTSDNTIPVGALSVEVAPDANNEYIIISDGNSVGYRCNIHNSHASHVLRVEPPATVAFTTGAAGKYAELDNANDNPMLSFAVITPTLYDVASSSGVIVTIES